MAPRWRWYWVDSNCVRCCDGQLHATRRSWPLQARKCVSIVGLYSLWHWVSVTHHWYYIPAYYEHCNCPTTANSFSATWHGQPHANVVVVVAVILAAFVVIVACVYPIIVIRLACGGGWHLIRPNSVTQAKRSEVGASSQLHWWCVVTVKFHLWDETVFRNCRSWNRWNSLPFPCTVSKERCNDLVAVCCRYTIVDILGAWSWHTLWHDRATILRYRLWDENPWESFKAYSIRVCPVVYDHVP